LLPTPAEKSRYVAAMFGRIAPRYDLMNTLMTLGQDRAWRAAAARQVPADARRVLDVGSGTGKLAQAVSKRLRRAQVVGVDFAVPMLRLGRPPGATAADVLALPFGDETFDSLVSAFVVRNLADVRHGLTEQVRVLRAGGRLVLLEITPGPRQPWRWVFRACFRGLVPFLGRLIAGDAAAYTYLPDSAAAFLEPERLAEVLCELGLSRVGTRRLAFGSVAIVAGTKRTRPAGLLGYTGSQVDEPPEG
jgi:demethylmenaquinone methyltransferase/2-methoxy-6-polyprenyl-1,4-benzoquinol methylase